MKKGIISALVLALSLSLTACGGGNPGSASTPAPASSPSADSPFEGKIGIVTSTVSQNEEEYRSAEELVSKYGEDKIVHVTWPDNYMTEQEQMVSIVQKLGADAEMKGIVFNATVNGTNAAVDKLKQTRPDIFIAYCTLQENPVDAAKRANLILAENSVEMGRTMVEQAAEMGAKTFTYYSFPRHQAEAMTNAQRELAEATCKDLGIEFVYATAPDPLGDAGVTGAQQFILEDIPKKVEEYGADTAFYATNCSMQIPIIKEVVELKAIYPQPCCPSPYHGFPTALGIETGEDQSDIQYIISETSRIIREAGDAGRVSSWPVPASMASTNACCEYIIKWINGEVPQEGIDVDALAQCMKDYAGMDIYLENYVENGQEYPMFQAYLMDYLVYE